MWSKDRSHIQGNESICKKLRPFPPPKPQWLGPVEYFWITQNIENQRIVSYVMIQNPYSKMHTSSWEAEAEDCGWKGNLGYLVRTCLCLCAWGGGGERWEKKGEERKREERREQKEKRMECGLLVPSRTEHSTVSFPLSLDQLCQSLSPKTSLWWALKEALNRTSLLQPSPEHWGRWGVGGGKGIREEKAEWL